jgi:hypothetical protein
MSMHPSPPTQIPTSSHHNPHQHSFFSPSTSSIQPLSNRACIRPGHARHSHPPLPHLLVRVAIHDRLLHVHSIPTWKASTGSASEPSPQYTNKAKRRNKMQPKNQRNSRMPISHRLRHGPEPHPTTEDKLRSAASMAPKPIKGNQNAKKKKGEKKRRGQKENGLQNPRHPPSPTRQTRRLPRRPRKKSDN